MTEMLNKKNIIMLIGASCSGKDTMCNLIVNNNSDIVRLPLLTTREKRIGELDYKDYIFLDISEFKFLSDNNFILEKRSYTRGNIITRYGTLNLDNLLHKFKNLKNINIPSKIYDMYIKLSKMYVDNNDMSFIVVGNIDMCLNIIEHESKPKIFPIILHIDDKDLLLRAIERESKQINPDYEEVARRFLSDKKIMKDNYLVYKLYSYINTTFNIDPTTIIVNASGSIDENYNRIMKIIRDIYKL